METAATTAERGTALTERDRFWLGHLKRIAGEGIEAKAYAAREKLSAQALYQGKKRLRQQGAWPEAKGSAAKPTFARVRLVEPAPVVASP